jgi:hypothetical protein
MSLQIRVKDTVGEWLVVPQTQRENLIAPTMSLQIRIKDPVGEWLAVP